jgi:hypothetical protein
VCRAEHPRAVILSYRACASRCENPFGQSDQKSPNESEEDETLQAVLLIGVFAAMGVVRPGMSTLPKDWADTDAYWARPANTVVPRVAAKKK